LKMVCVDEAHLYVMHGLYFRPKFFKLKEILFDKMKNSNIPVVFMTATATKDMIGHIKQLSGLDILSENITWASSEGIQRRDVIVEVCWKEQVIRDFKDLADNILGSTEFTKIIVYTNSKALSNELASKIRGHLNNTGLPGDVIHVDGDLFKEQKFHNIAIFLHHGKIGNPKDPLNPLDPRILVATSGAANAGIDSADVYLVLRDGFPPSIADLLQELGRAGRRMASSCITGLIDRYRINISLKSFVSLVKRIRAAPSSGGAPSICESFSDFTFFLGTLSLETLLFASFFSVLFFRSAKLPLDSLFTSVAFFVGVSKFARAKPRLFFSSTVTP
jgi:superfamily II DNA helicase RecQ